MRPRGSRLAKLALACALALVLLEVGWRLVLRARTGPYDADATRARVEQLASGMTSAVPTLEAGEFAGAPREELRALSPYYGWESPQSQQALVEQQSFCVSAERKNVFLVLVLGGSVAQHMTRGPATAGTFREALGALPRVAGREVVVLGWARGSFKQPQQVMLFTYLVALGIVPDALVEIDGFNEVALGNDNAHLGVHPLQPHWPMWGRLASGRALSADVLDGLAELHTLRGEAQALAGGSALRFASAVTGTLVARRAESLHARFADAQTRLVATIGAQAGDDPARGPRYAGDTAAALEACARGWEESSRALHAACLAHGVPYLHVLQPTLHDDGSKPRTAQEVERGGAAAAWIEGAQRGYPLLREHGERLARDGVPFVDLSRIFADFTETAYVDVCHFHGAAMRKFSERVAKELAQRLAAR